MKLWAKIGGGFGVVLLVFLVVSGLAIVKMNRVTRSSADLANVTMPQVLEVAAIRRDTLMARMLVAKFQLTKDPAVFRQALGDLKEAVEKTVLVRQSLSAESQAEVIKDLERIGTQLGNYEQLATTTAKNYDVLAAKQKEAKEVADGYLVGAVHFRDKLLNGRAHKDEAAQGGDELARINGVIETGNQALVEMWRAIALREIPSLAGTIKKVQAIGPELDELRKTTTDTESLGYLDDIGTFGDAYQAVIEQLVDMSAEFDRLEQQREASGDEVLTLANELSEKVFRRVQNDTTSDADALQAAARVSVVGLIVGAAIAILFAVALTSRIVGPVNKAVAMAKEIERGSLSRRLRLVSKDEIGELGKALDTMADGLQAKARLAVAIAEGDLREEVHLASGDDVLGRALQTMSENLNRTLGRVNEAIEQVNSGSVQVSDASQSLSQGATEQAASLQEITSSTTEISEQTRTSAGNATLATSLAREALSASEDGSTSIAQMMTAMDEIQSSSKDVKKIIKVIDDIAFQTNLLALNAAVEAARAGSHGKGFAVVAEEVRGLAAKSAKAAQDSAERIEDSIRKVEHGSEVAHGTVGALAQISEKAAKVTNLIAEIAAAANEQSQGVAQINIGLQQVDAVTQQNTANAEETASAAAELSSQAAELRKLISQFKLKA